jgi:hypothetical protein
VYLLLLRGDAESVITRSVASFDLVALGAPDGRDRAASASHWRQPESFPATCYGG